MNIKLIEECYENKYGIDLKTLHHNKSFYESKVQNEKLIQYKKDNIHKLKNIIFDDGISTSFEVIIHNNLLYLLGDKSCYPCGNIIHSSSDTFWVPVYILPNNNKIQITRDVLNSSVLYFLSSYDYINQIESTLFNTYITDYLYSFSDNIWCGRTDLKSLISSYNRISSKEIFLLLKKYDLLTPFEFIVGSFILNYEVSFKEVYIFLIKYRKQTYLDYYCTQKFNYAKSSNEIISDEDFYTYAFQLDENEVKDFFNYNFIIENLFIDNIINIDINDLLEINISGRYCLEEYGRDLQIANEKYKNKLQQEFNISDEFKTNFNKKFITRLKEIEKYIRNSKGFKDVGSYYKEIQVLNYFKESLPQYKIVAQHSPKWLGRQRFDVYIKELNIAIEYNGKQHYEEISFFGGLGSLEQNKLRDSEKYRKCVENNCQIFIVRYDEDLYARLSEILREIENLI